MSQTILLLLSFGCVALLYALFATRLSALCFRRYAFGFLRSTSVICGIIALQSCHSSSGEENKEKSDAAAVEAPPTELVLAQKGKLSSTLQLPGELIAFQQVDIYAKVSSFVKKLYVDVGSEVKEGDLLATMEAPEINSQLAGAESRLQSQEALYIASKANYDRLLETSRTPGTISPNDLDIALAKEKSDYAELQSAKAAHTEISDTKSYLQIRAPFSGVISARNVSAGAYVGPSGKGSDMPIFTLQEQRHLRLAADIPEAYTGFLKDGSVVSFTVRSLPNEHFTATVKRLAGALDTHLRSERIEMDVINDNKRLLPGMVSEISVPLPATDSTIIVPATAVVNGTERVAVIKVTNGRTVWIDVKKGRAANGKAEVYGNISQGDTLVKAASEEVRDGNAIGKTVMVKE